MRTFFFSFVLLSLGSWSQPAVAVPAGYKTLEQSTLDTDGCAFLNVGAQQRAETEKGEVNKDKCLQEWGSLVCAACQDDPASDTEDCKRAKAFRKTHR